MKKILVVEDDELIQSSLKEALEIKGYQVIQATCVKQTWQYLDDSIDLMIMDIRCLLYTSI